jgi:hypothetical protein
MSKHRKRKNRAVSYRKGCYLWQPDWGGTCDRLFTKKRRTIARIIKRDCRRNKPENRGISTNFHTTRKRINDNWGGPLLRGERIN